MREGHIIVAVESHSRLKAGRHLQRKQPVAYRLIDAKALKLMLLVDKTEAIAILKCCSSRHIE